MGNTALINICRGIKGGECRFALSVENDFEERIQDAIENTGWPEFLKERYGEKINRHKLVTVNAAACPNGCSRPHISDIGLIRACVPVIDHEACVGCEECVRKCPDDAMQMVDGRVVITREKCLVCGFCVGVCPVEAITCSRTGWRFLVGGRLGRHPRLGTELPGVYTSEEVLSLISKCLRLWMNNYQEDRRFGWIMERVGYEKLLQD